MAESFALRTLRRALAFHTRERDRHADYLYQAENNPPDVEGMDPAMADATMHTWEQNLAQLEAKVTEIDGLIEELRQGIIDLGGIP